MQKACTLTEFPLKSGVIADGHELSVSLLPESQEVLLLRLDGGIE
jgi:hypothetical protein